MKKSLKGLYFGFLVGVVLAIGVFIFVLNDGTITGKSFVRNCALLNGKDLTIGNIKTLKGKVYVTLEHDYTKLVEPEDEHIQQFKDAMNGKIPDEKSEHVLIINNFKLIPDNFSFIISRNDLENDFECIISINTQARTGKIKSIPYSYPVD